MPARWICIFRLLSRSWPAGAARLLLWGLLSVGEGPALAQSAAVPAPAGEALPFRFENPRRRHMRLPFEFQRNLIIVQASLNGLGPYNFLLDTGVSTSLITDPGLAAPLKLRRGEVFRVSGVGEEAPLEAYLSDSVRVTMPGVVAPALSFLVLSSDVLNLSGYVGMPIHGILGYDVFRSFVLEVEPSAAELVLHAPSHYRPPRGRRWTQVPLVLQRRKAYLTVPVSVSDSLALPLKLVLDTGAGHALSIETNSDSRLRIPSERLRAQLGRGLSGAINGYLGRVRGMQLGRYHLSTLLTSFPDSTNGALRADVPRNGNIGFELLKRFDLVIDYPHQTLLLKPNRLFRDPFEHDMCGIELLATGPNYRRYLIQKIHPGSPAARAGLQPDDELLAINLLPASNISLTEVSRILHSADGRVLFLLLRRADGELYTTRLRLKRQI
jgi:hypothetical protein